MQITQLRNATLIVEFGEVRLLVDPMLAAQGQLPALKYLARRRRNPLVELPDNASEHLQRVTHCLITHCQKGHFDHLDRSAIRWLRERNIPVLCMAEDADYLRKRRLNVQELPSQAGGAFFNGTIQAIPCLHGEGFIGSLMAHGYGYFIQIPQEPSLYIAGDTLLTAEVRQCLTQLAPAVSVLPAGGARFDLGGEIIMGQADILAALQLSSGIIVANHLEALDHCPVTRAGLLQEATRRGISERLRVPLDGETLEFSTEKQRLVAG
ncbi:MBL fold metallo-hydrolase [Aquipseudomonas guryensis]|jgi:L-ascorbate metabolism protein UlaG (beta-lactamase superfamily)|uniref:MBL fold metallo-hydrolase n=1 Tax=Aquipseudomonas guryensis TaxID=2759165 RepID=A0A7W4DB21_9GAMM|nr:MBL fold metallo-hydrolase [Pseudomonas guryensis]MBB1519238.1 MBL fold metallo-hydrolase [Pseudomonas guryensis]